MISLIQILSLCFVLFAASRVILRAKDKKISLGELLFWSALWFGLIVIVFFPEVTTFFAQVLGIGRGIDVVIYSSIALLFYLIFRLYVKQEENQKELTLLVREFALKNKREKK